MKVVIYRGEKTKLGTHGFVKPGDKLELSEMEFQSVIKDARFELVESKPIDRGTDYVPPLPQIVRNPETDGVIFDLRRINWREPKIIQWLDCRPKGYILELGRAMKMLGFNIDIATRIQKREIIDSVISEARSAGWLSMEQRIVSEPITTLEDPLPDDEEEVEEEEQGALTTEKPKLVLRRRKKKHRK